MDGHDSDGSGEYDRLGYETHQMPGAPPQLGYQNTIYVQID